MKNMVKITLLVCMVGVVVSVSGCTSSNAEKLIWEQNLTGTSFSGDTYAVNTNGSSKIRIDYSNLTFQKSSNSPSTKGVFNVYVLNTIPSDGQTLANYAHNLVDNKQVLTNETPKTGSLVIENNKMKGVLIFNSECKGNIKVYVL